ncbi:MAG: bifunctional 4-hydroxy-2-oxoglutarate aldolase/2-dehydro-3-deoxy-phosphogluconate aldolase [Chitinophagaceae bacterium]
MAKTSFSWQLFEQCPIVGIVRGLAANDIKTILPLYRDAGLHTIEITLNTADALSIIQYIRKHSNLNVGAGTVCTEKDAEKALDAGAQFIVTPITDKKVIKHCVKKKVPVFPGAFTPTEIYQAWSLGASMVKVYPAKSLGPSYIKDIKAPLDKIKLLPTGGIGLNDIIAYKEAGADGFGIGSPLFPKTLVEEKNWDALALHFKKFAELVLPKSV